MVVEEFLATLGIKKGFLIGGLLGAAASLKFVFTDLDWRGKITMLFSGSIAAAYITPIIVHRLHLADEEAYGAAFIVGVFGMSLIAAVLSTVKQLDLKGIIESWTKRG